MICSVMGGPYRLPCRTTCPEKELLTCKVFAIPDAAVAAGVHIES
jgi:hypothetical protein